MNAYTRLSRAALAAAADEARAELWARGVRWCVPCRCMQDACDYYLPQRPGEPACGSCRAGLHVIAVEERPG